MMRLLLKTIFSGVLLAASASSFADVLIENGGDSVQRGNSEYVFSFDNLSEHNKVLLNFDLYVLDSWDGLSSSSYGQDFFGFKIDDGTEHVWSFAYGFSQYMNDPSKPKDDTYLTGNFNNSKWGARDQYYENFYNGFYIPHTSSELTITFFGRGLQGITDESWIADSIRVETTNELSFDTASSFLLEDVSAPFMIGSLFLLAAPLLRKKED